ncbi:MAG: SpoVG family protein [Oscillospiraceae bacterium]|nr:SpoVG family protein [Oscillospiraceae bacterium]
MEISDIKVRKTFDEGPLKAIVSVTFDDELALHDVKIIYAKDKLFLIMPSRKNTDGSYKDIVHPINSEFRLKLESAILASYHEVLEAQKNAADDGLEDDVEDEESEEI